ncbi:Hsp20/alpha crystallin family protein [Longivirga aurantiaca]|uniref:Hsp20/alpha crystallin family protein n=1 Tax=Longivirga aurantiaca TaxID=1837743 RepID=A0ABW1T1D3_9ACTN
MTTIEKYERPTFQDVLWSTWPFSSLALEFPVRDMASMRIEEFMDGDTLVVRAELPGIDPAKDVEITVADGFMTIAAERTQEKTEGEEGKPGYRSEFSYGSYRRVVRMPAGVREDDVTATYHDGILEVRVPVASEPPTPGKVPVTRV